MTRIVSIFVSSIAMSLLSLAAQAVELGDSPLALVSEGDLQAIVAHSSDDSQALVQLSGVDHPLDGVVMLADIEQRADDSVAYRAEVDGQMRSLVVYHQSPWASTDYTAYLPGQEEPFAVQHNEDRSAQIDLAELNAQYEQQMGEGVQERLARFDRNKAVQRQQRALEAIDQSASRVCGSPVTTKVDWSGLSDDQVNSLSISGYCGQVAAEMEYLCLSDDSFKQRVKAISEIDCGFANTLNLSRDNETVVFQTAEQAKNQRESINGFLQTL